MTPLAQRIALGSLEGFQWYSTVNGLTEDRSAFMWQLVYRLPPEEGIGKAWTGCAGETRAATKEEIEANWRQLDPNTTWLPDYLNDLNVIRRVEYKVINTPFLERSYAVNLSRVSGGSPDTLVRYGFYTLTATAAQRAEAILRTFNLWDDTK